MRASHLSLASDNIGFYSGYKKDEFSTSSIKTLEIKNNYWVDQSTERLKKLINLDYGWDGYQGEPVTSACAFFAGRIIAELYMEGVYPPCIIPGNDGTLQLEWHQSNHSIEIDILAPNNIEVSKENHTTGEIIEQQLTTDFTILSKWLYDIREPRPRHLAAV